MAKRNKKNKKLKNKYSYKQITIHSVQSKEIHDIATFVFGNTYLIDDFSEYMI